jgi:hypothetical protein
MRILCLRLVPRQRDAPSSEVDRLRTAAELEEFSPSIGWHDCGGRWCFCLDVTGTSRWFGGEGALLERLREWCDERRFAASAAIAPSLGAGWAVVHYAQGEITSTFTARIVPTERTVEILAPLPVEALRLDRETTSLLLELGVTEIGPLYYLPREALAERFVPELLDRLDQASSMVGELFTPYRPNPKHEVVKSSSCGNTASRRRSCWRRFGSVCCQSCSPRSRRAIAALPDYSLS